MISKGRLVTKETRDGMDYYTYDDETSGFVEGTPLYNVYLVINACKTANYQEDGISDNLISNVDFLDRFTQNERISIINSNDAHIKDLYGYCLASKNIDLLSTRVNQGIAYLVYKGVISEQRSSEILGV